MAIASRVAFIEAFSQRLQQVLSVYRDDCRTLGADCVTGDKSARFIWWRPFFGSVFLGEQKNERTHWSKVGKRLISGVFVLFCAAKKEPKKAAHQINRALLSPGRTGPNPGTDETEL